MFFLINKVIVVYDKMIGNWDILEYFTSMYNVPNRNCVFCLQTSGDYDENSNIQGHWKISQTLPSHLQTPLLI